MAIVKPISSSDIQTEFGGIDPIGMSEYYRGGVNVQSNTNTQSIPLSGQISFGNFDGTSKFDTLSVSVANISNTITPAYNAGSQTAQVTATAIPANGTTPVVYSWTDITVPANPNIVISNAGNIVNPTFSFTANPTHGDSVTEISTWKVAANDGITTTTTTFTISLTISKQKQPVGLSWTGTKATNQVAYGLSNSVSLSRTVVVTGGRGPYNYSWVWVSGTSFALTNTTTPTATFAYSQNLTGPADTGVVYGIYKVTVTDTFDGEVVVFTATNVTGGTGNIGLQLIEDRFLGTIGITANSVINSKTDVFGTVGNNVAVSGGTTGSHAAGYAITSYAWTRVTGTTFSISGNTTTIPSWTYTNDIAGPFDTGYISETWQLIVTDQYGLTQTSTATVQLRLIENAGAPPVVNAGLDKTGSATTNYGSINTTSVSSVSSITTGDHPISTIQWSYVSGTSFVITNATATNATFTLTENLVGPASWPLRQGIYRLTVTDNVSQTVSDDVVITLQHTETITGSILPDANAGTDVTGTNSGPAGSPAITAQTEITTAAAYIGTYSLDTNPIYWELVNFSNAAFTVDLLLNTWLPNNATNITPLFSRSEDLLPGGSSSHTATYRMRVKDIQGQISPIDSGSDVLVTLNLSESNDTAPDAFTFTDRTNVSLNTVIESNVVTILGITTSVAVTLSGNAGSIQMSINGGAWVTTGSISNNQTLQVRGTSSSSGVTALTIIPTIGGVSDTFSITTLLPPLSVSVSPTSLTTSENAVTGQNFSVTSANMVASGQSGTPGYTYQWSLISGQSYTITNQQTDTVTFTFAGAGPADTTVLSVTGIYRVTVTDSVAGTATSSDISISFNITGIGI